MGLLLEVFHKKTNFFTGRILLYKNNLKNKSNYMFPSTDIPLSPSLSLIPVNILFCQTKCFLCLHFRPFKQSRSKWPSGQMVRKNQSRKKVSCAEGIKQGIKDGEIESAHAIQKEMEERKVIRIGTTVIQI